MPISRRNDVPRPEEHRVDDIHAAALYDLLQLLDSCDYATHQKLIQARLAQLAADGCSQSVLELYDALAHRLSSLMINQHIQGALKELEDQSAASAAKLIEPVNDGPGRRKGADLTREQFLAQYGFPIVSA
jgi:D-alanine-D-alanine ligase-like ATP-grasp enzyme